jgi:hypothetical protein
MHRTTYERLMDRLQSRSGSLKRKLSRKIDRMKGDVGRIGEKMMEWFRQHDT